LFGLGALVTLFMALMPLLAACGFQSGDASGLAPDQSLIWPYFRVANVSEAVFDPALLTWALDAQNAFTLRSGLVTFNSSLTQVVGDSASSWDIGGDGAQKGTIYTFHLRSGLHFSDGTPLTADDFAYSIDRALDPNLCAKGASATYAANGQCDPSYVPALTYLSHIVGANARAAGTISTMIGHGDAKKGLDVVDPLTLQIRLDAPIAYFIQTLTYPASFPVEKKLIDRYPNGEWVQHLDEGGSNGPWKIASYQTEAGKQQGVTMEPNPYWTRPGVKPLTLKKLIRPFYDSEETEYTDYRAGKLDFTDVPPNTYFNARSQADFYEVAALQTNYFGLNLGLEPFTQSDPNSLLIRRALDLALNKQLLVDRVENGGSLPSNHIVPHGMPGYSDNLTNPPPDGTQSLTGNQKAAQSLIKQAQTACTQAEANATLDNPAPGSCPYVAKNNPQPIKLVVPNSSATRVSISQFAAQQWNSVLGLNVQAVPTPSAVFSANFHPNSPYQMWIIGWVADYPDAQDWISLQFGCNASANFHSYCNPTLDALMKKADQEQDPQKRLQEYNNAEQVVINDVVWIPYEQAKYAWRQKPWVRGFGLNTELMVFGASWSNVYIASH
jgi:peptide/nickel transport system substrate-binding protein/oligopeptide transport system substrate-binding protein